MKEILGIVFSLSLLITVNGQEVFVYPENYKTIQDSSFTPGDILVVEYNFLMDDWKLEPHDWTISLYNFLKDHPDFDFVIESHTDSRGSTESNLILSNKRAQSIVNDLIELGIDPNKLTAVGKGESEVIYSDEVISKLKTDEEREKAHAINRRTELHLEKRKN